MNNNQSGYLSRPYKGEKGLEFEDIVIKCNNGWIGVVLKCQIG